MNSFAFVLLCVVVGLTTAEPPRFRSGRFQSRFLSRQEAEATTPAAEPEAESPAPYPPASGPYPPSGWRPQGKSLELPSSKTEATTPAQEYGTPDEKYGVPTTPPPATDSTTVAEDVTTVEPESESIDSNLTVQNGRLRQSQRIQIQNADAEEGALYVLLPDSTFQKIYSPRAARINSRFSGRLLQEVQPLDAPVIVYARQNSRF